ncbi:uncharacterized protein LOC144159537 [Haemaphysalis longicornis]
MARRRRLPHDASSSNVRRRNGGFIAGSGHTDSESRQEDGTVGRLKPRPLQRNAANARERARMRVLSRAFTRLKTSLPWVPEDTKLSKLDTLRLAAGYIGHLRQVLLADDESSTATSPSGTDGECSPPRSLHPLTLTWPFSFHQRLTSPPGNDAESKGRLLNTSCRIAGGVASSTPHRSPEPHQHPHQPQHAPPSSCPANHRCASGVADDGFDSFLDYLSSPSGPSHHSQSGRFLPFNHHRPICSS